jgi:hypothetical protein
VWGGAKPLQLSDLPSPDRLDEGGVHELAHGLVGEQLGLDILKYELWRTRSKFGVAGFTHIASGPKNEEELRAHLCVCVAGQEGAMHWYVTVHGYDLDRAKAESAIGSYQDLLDFKQLSEFIDFPEKAARLEARRIIKAQWSRIMKGAVRLADRGKLSPGSV